LATETNKATADALQKAVSTGGAEATVRVVPTGPDIERGWGKRLSVARDYIYATPILLGTTRLGPDLANVGLRHPDAAWQFLHLYDPKLEVPDSIMPRYPFLFQRQPKIPGRPAPDALPIPGDEEIIPTRAAKALVAYLTTLKAEAPLFEAPGPQLPLPATADTNQPPSTAAPITNAPPPERVINIPSSTNQGARP
jgi:cytochrome c oxidase cbb3-type subunit 2